MVFFKENATINLLLVYKLKEVKYIKLFIQDEQQ